MCRSMAFAQFYTFLRTKVLLEIYRLIMKWRFTYHNDPKSYADSGVCSWYGHRAMQVKE
jgi:hypothetical protein